jgi:hypothetical protein
MGKNAPFIAAYKAATDEMELLLKEQERIEDRILSLRKTMNALATVIAQHDSPDKSFTDFAAAAMRSIIDTSLTEDILRIINAAKGPLTASEIRAELNELGGSLIEHSNPLASIHAILSRLTESGRAHETVRDGKKAWERVARMAEAFAQARKRRNPLLSGKLAPFIKPG